MQKVKIHSQFTKDIDWAVRFLTIYNINASRDSEIIQEIGHDLSVVDWSKQTEAIRQKLFMERLRETVNHYRKATSIAA